jgi:type IV pilus assembly protein PilO
MADSVLTRLPLPAKLGVSAGVVSLVAVAYFVVFYGDVASKIEVAARQEGTLKAELQSVKKAQSEYNKDLAELTEREQRQADLNKILPQTTEYPAFLSSLQTVANGTGVSLAAWTPKEEARKEYYAKIPMSLELTGRYHQIARFFFAVGQLERIINMENIALASPQRQGEDVVVKVKARATAFRGLSEEVVDTKQDKRAKAQGKR